MKKIVCLLLVLAAMLALCGCNQTIIDTTYHFDYAYVSLPDGTHVEGEVKGWRDWDDSSVMQVTFADGTVYYTHSSNIVLIARD